ncbi:hypothetical protein MTR67_042382 [Solanum verrucosum]|uniref:WRKY domain-containing protein n=1 Tax=Solanum verrucosum TaxID=315347 RepID=A0AAF0UMG3_SOLVR|nr:hypothetical protein MTR67_042382 [Solanum verrucosum]
MDFYVVLECPGYRVARRGRCKSRVGIQHRVTKEDSMKWFQVKYEGVILNKSSNIHKKGAKKRVISVPIKDCDISRSNYKGDVYPPSDSCTWRKYGQKPIKGSPYPRGYYRCSSLKGCPAKKQVERCHHDPNVLIITYSSDHNHPPPVASTKHRHLTTTFAATNTDQSVVFTYQPENDFIMAEVGARELLGCFSYVGPT